MVAGIDLLRRDRGLPGGLRPAPGARVDRGADAAGATAQPGPGPLQRPVPGAPRRAPAAARRLAGRARGGAAGRASGWPRPTTSRPRGGLLPAGRAAPPARRVRGGRGRPTAGQPVGRSRSPGWPCCAWPRGGPRPPAAAIRRVLDETGGPAGPGAAAPRVRRDPARPGDVDGGRAEAAAELAAIAAALDAPAPARRWPPTPAGRSCWPRATPGPRSPRCAAPGESGRRSRRRTRPRGPGCWSAWPAGPRGTRTPRRWSSTPPARCCPRLGAAPGPGPRSTRWPGRARPPSPGGLTARELQVLRLVAAGQDQPRHRRRPDPQREDGGTATSATSSPSSMSPPGPRPPPTPTSTTWCERTGENYPCPAARGRWYFSRSAARPAASLVRPGRARPRRRRWMPSAGTASGSRRSSSAAARPASSVGYHLARRGLPFVILDAGERIGDAWRQRWDSLRLFTPARSTGWRACPSPPRPALLPHQGRDGRLPGGLRGALRAAGPHGRHGGRRSPSEGDRFVVTAGERRFEAENVVVAMGAYQRPRVPAFAGRAGPGDRAAPLQRLPQPVPAAGRRRLSSWAPATRAPRSPSSWPPASPTWLSGRDTGHDPFRAGSRPAGCSPRSSGSSSTAC